MWTPSGYVDEDGPVVINVCHGDVDMSRISLIIVANALSVLDPDRQIDLSVLRNVIYVDPFILIQCIAVV